MYYKIIYIKLYHSMEFICILVILQKKIFIKKFYEEQTL